LAGFDPTTEARLDLAIAKAYTEEVFTDEINPPPTNSKRS
jgi:hypothetical protein